MSFIYIASPYSDPDPAVREKRYLAACYYTVKLLSARKFPYSPIVSNHHLALEFGLNYTANDWMAYNFAMLSSAKELHVLTIEGWDKSVGLTAEVNFWRALRQGSPIYYIDFDGRAGSRKLARGNKQCAPALKGG